MTLTEKQIRLLVYYLANLIFIFALFSLFTSAICIGVASFSNQDSIKIKINTLSKTIDTTKTKWDKIELLIKEKKEK